MKGEHVVFSNHRNTWETPDWVFEMLDNEFHFTLDPCADDVNHRCDFYYTEKDNGLAKNWGGHRVFCNPPYNEITRWVRKCYCESLQENTIVVMLIPARVDTKWFHDYVYRRAEVRFIRGRLKYGNSKINAPFPTMIVIFRGPKM